MSDIRVEVISNDIMRTLNLMEREVAELVGAAAEHGRSLMVTAIQTRSPSSGPVTRYNPRRTAYPAAEGQAPNTDTGNLVNSIQVEDTRTPTEKKIVVGAEYGEALEYGGHPFAVPAADQLTKDMPGIVAAGLRRLRP